jgi:hypothetical protein
MALSTVLSAAFFLLMGLGELWVGWYLPHAHARRAAPTDSDTPVTVFSSLRGRLWWRIAFTMAGLGFICFGITTLRYTRGQYVSVPATAPQIDQAIGILAIICICGSLAIGVAWALAQTAQQNSKRRTRRDDPSGQ